MKKFKMMFQVVLLLTIAASCSKYDDGELWDKVNSLDDRVTSIENQLKSLNNDIVSISGLADVLQNSLFITNITMSKNGYTLTFSDGSKITISDGASGKDGKDGEDGVDGADGSDGKDGKDGVDGSDGKDGVDGKDGMDGADGSDGKDGKDGVDGNDGKDGVNGTDGRDGKDAPVINIRYFEGRYYWVQTVNGETTWLTDNDGNKIPASGADGVTPLLRVNAGGYWIISYDNGSSFSLLRDENGNAIKASGNDGDSFFESVEVTEDGLRIVLKDGTVIVIPLGEPVSYKDVDLGLSVRWASFNLGATEPTGLGGLYLWGYAGSNEGVPNYEAPDVDNISGTQYDIVRAAWGDTWRMPSFDELKELAADCVWKRVTLNGVTGMNVTGSNGRSVFIPAAGWVMQGDGSIEPERQDILNGYYWAGDSFLLDSNRMGHSLFFCSVDGVDTNVIWNADLFKLAIRPVKG